jgi:hypothetical protein
VLGRAQVAAHEEPPIIQKGPVHAAAADARCAAAGPGARSVAVLTDLKVHSVDGSTCAPCGRSLPYATSHSPLLLIRIPGWCAWPPVSYGPRNRSVQGPGRCRVPCSSVALRATTLHMARPAELRTREQSKPGTRCAGTRSSWSAEPPCHRASAAALTGTQPGLQQLQPVPPASPISSLPVADR